MAHQAPLRAKSRGGGGGPVPVVQLPEAFQQGGTAGSSPVLLFTNAVQLPMHFTPKKAWRDIAAALGGMSPPEVLLVVAWLASVGSVAWCRR